MSEDRAAEIIRHVSAMAGEFGEHRQEMRQLRQEFTQFRGEINSRLGNVESQLVSRIASAVIATGADVEELRDRVTLLEGEGSSGGPLSPNRVRGGRFAWLKRSSA